MVKKIKYIIPLLGWLLPTQGNWWSSLPPVPEKTGKDIVTNFTSVPGKEFQANQNEDFLVLEKTHLDKEKTKTLDTIEPPHDKIINMNFDTILSLYGNEKWMELIREHFLIEINKERSAVGNPPLKFNDTLNKVAKDRAIKMAEEKIYSHTIDWKSAAKEAMETGYDIQWFLSNISCMPITKVSIHIIIQSYINNKKFNTKHHEMIDNKEYKDLWFWWAEGEDKLWYIEADCGE